MVTIIEEEDYKRGKTIFRVEVDRNIKDWEEAKKELYNQLIDENNKYKRAFEILKDRLNLEVWNYELDDESPYLYATNGKSITMEEYKLLEELLNG